MIHLTLKTVHLAQIPVMMLLMCIEVQLLKIWVSREIMRNYNFEHCFQLFTVKRLCGEEAPEPVIVYGSKTYIEFNSDRTVSVAGFRINWTAGKVILYLLIV